MRSLRNEKKFNNIGQYQTIKKARRALASGLFDLVSKLK